MTGSALVSPGLVSAAFAGESRSPAMPDEFELTVQPSRVFRRTADFNRERLESIIATLILRTSLDETAERERLVLTLRASGATRVVQTYDRSALAPINMLPARKPGSGQPPFRLFAMRLISLHPQALSIDAADCLMIVRRSNGQEVEVAKTIPIETFAQQAKLIFPFRGPGIITQGGAMNDGHRNRSGMFAVDAMAMSDVYAVMRKDGDSSDSAAGWGRNVIAPASGTVITARADRPDQPLIGNADPKYFLPEFPDGGDPGNHLIIDHGTGEFSMLAHFQQNTLRVKAGDRVTQGQVLGLLGSSGDSSAPHVHHHLQAGPSLITADALPHHYENGPGRRHDRGWMFNAR